MTIGAGKGAFFKPRGEYKTYSITMRKRPVLNVTLEQDIDSAVRAWAIRQGRPLSWVVSDILRAGLRTLGKPLARVGAGGSVRGAHAPKSNAVRQ